MGEALYGDRWQTDFARALGVSDRTVRRWQAGSTPMPDGVWGEIATLIAERLDTLAAVLARIERRHS